MKKVSEENGETTKERAVTVSPTRVSAPVHELKRTEKHHQNLRDSPVRLTGASHKKARLLSNKTHYSPRDPDARISVKPGKAFYTNRDGNLLKNYWAAPKDCKACPMKPQCVPNTKCKKIIRTIYDEQYLSACARQHSEKGKRMKKLRQSTVEPVFGSLTQFYGLRKIGVLGKAGAHKVMLMAAITFKLKKYLKKGGGKPSVRILKTIMDAFQGFLTIFIRQIQPRLVLLKAW